MNLCTEGMPGAGREDAYVGRGEGLQRSVRRETPERGGASLGRGFAEGNGAGEGQHGGYSELFPGGRYLGWKKGGGRDAPEKGLGGDPGWE